ncbi:MAG: hypothetical protein K9J06_15775 [Flavobacteriales bacterium]|nr:hypothetical protein [Flavobacteriales bacterium]
MKTIACSFLIFISLHGFAQESEIDLWENDTSSFRKAVDFLREGDTPRGIAVLNERLQTDSVCPFLYLATAVIKLWDFDYFGDSAIADVDRYIYLRTHPDEAVCLEQSALFQLWEFHMLNYQRPRELGMKSLPRRAIDILQGLNAYFKPGFNDHCYHWKEAVENGFPKAQFLVDKYCKGE